MQKVIINKTFESLKACDEWEKENLKSYIPDGMVLLMSNHKSALDSDEVTLESIFVC